MSSNISIFSFESQDVRFVDGKPVANDVAIVLGYKNPADAVYRLVKEKNKGICKVQTPGGMQSVAVLEEAGIYQLIFGSKLTSAERFQDWVFEEVLPTLRETGTYTIGDSAKDEFSSHVDGSNKLLLIKLIATSVECVLEGRVEPDLLRAVTARNIAKAIPELTLTMADAKETLPCLPIPNALLTVSQLCKLIEEETGEQISAIALNKKLQQRGLQYRNDCDNPRWLPTDLGKEHGTVVLDTARSRDKTVQVLKWYRTVLDLLEDYELLEEEED